MKTIKKQFVSIVIPCYNESQSIEHTFSELLTVLKQITHCSFAVVFVNDGSTDNTLALLRDIADKSPILVSVVNLSKNFGKEIATTAGINYASGDAVIMIDADGQHPVELIPEFIEKWNDGAQIVTGLRLSNQKEGFIKKFGSKFFYALFNSSAGVSITPGSTDFRLIDRSIRDLFVELKENNRITRGLIDWLGFTQEYIHFEANARYAGDASYSTRKLFSLAMNTFVSLSLKPLIASFYLGIVVLPLSILMLLFSVIEMWVGDPLLLQITGSGYLILVSISLISLLLMSQGIMAIYLSHIHSEAKGRPLYIVDKKNSVGIDS